MLQKIIKFTFFILIFQSVYLLAESSKYVEGEIIVKYKPQASSFAQSQAITVSISKSSIQASVLSALGQSGSLSTLNNKYQVISAEKVFKETPKALTAKTMTLSSNGVLIPDLSNIYTLKFSKEFDAKDVAEEFSKDPNIEYAEPNYYYELFLIPNDPYFANQWGLDNTGQLGGTAGVDINALNAWDITTGSEDVIIAVVDTGVDYNHGDLVDNIWVNIGEIPNNGIDDDGNGKIDDYNGWDFANDAENSPDTHGHGTHCAGIIGAKGNNGIGITGVCWNVKIMALKCHSGGDFLTKTYLAIKYAVDNGAKIISCSFGSSLYSYIVNEAIQYARSKGCVVVAAAGNSNSSSYKYPAAYDGVVAVANTDDNDKKSRYSSYGSWIDISAPGTNIYSTIPNNKYGYKTGTSMAAPMVAGLAGLLLAADPTLMELEIIARIKNYAEEIDDLNPSYQNQMGTGRINLYASLLSQNLVQVISVDKKDIIQGEDVELHIYGSKFYPNLTVSIRGLIINHTTIISQQEIIINASVNIDASIGLTDIIVQNENGSTGIGKDLIEIFPTSTKRYSIRGVIKSQDDIAMPNIVVNLTGDSVSSVETDVNGNYSFNVFEGNYQIKPVQGDNIFVFSPTVKEVFLSSDFIQNFILNIEPDIVKWRYSTNSGVDSSPTIDENGTIYFGSAYKNIYAISSNGIQLWTFETGANVYSSPLIGDDNIIYIGSWDAKLYAINTDGTKKWDFETGGYIDSSPAIGSNGTIYVGSWDGKLYAINADGTKKWDFETKDKIRSSPAVGSDGTIYVGSCDGKLYAINVNGTKKWSLTTGGYIDSSPAIGSDGTIYVGSCDGKLYAINADGTKKWDFETNYLIYSSPIIGEDDVVYVGSADHKLYAINADGTKKWDFKTGGAILESLLIDNNGIIYFGSTDDKIYAINSDGTKRWSLTTGGDIYSSPAMSDDGTLYVGSTDGYLYAIATDANGLADSPWPMFHKNQQHTGNRGLRYKISGYVKDTQSNAMVGVIVSLTGLENQTYLTDQNGYFEFIDLVRENYKVFAHHDNYQFDTDFYIYNDLKNNIELANFTGKIIKYELEIDNSKDQEKNIKADFGEINIEIPAGTFAEGDLDIEIITPPASTKHNIQTTDIALEIKNTELLQPSNPVILKFSYNNSEVNSLDESKLTVMRYILETDQWLSLPSEVDTINNIVTATLTHFSTFALVLYTPPNNLQAVKAYPNPFDPVTNLVGMKITSLTANSKIKIYNILGQLVRELEDFDGNGTEIWDGRNQVGNIVSSGIYIIYIQGDDDRKKIKIAVEK
ncbi:MAG: PQQ-binding-like beta-propeller repeat protein [bacterium]|nr:PQQ-binding-like beta-propeller repeat protein [bacterium]